ncbi:hypothetical protein V2A60_007339 [Cordyceps javanica]|uniref:RecQ mediated genome instability protein Rmi1 n=1 Tax=Cordyceps javanica TaxID=43265 RepID=A0A545W850_9HYPO|nr:RecQ mediated genome instability protein Rmi1 [Cordyceps javanica]TQW10180.1 RecQ mediated genome instability protein Rmi1 [Cordyceps javanica]
MGTDLGTCIAAIAPVTGIIVGPLTCRECEPYRWDEQRRWIIYRYADARPITKPWQYRGDLFPDNLEAGDVNCRYSAMVTVETKDRCAMLMRNGPSTVEKLFMLNPGLAGDCSNIKYNTPYSLPNMDLASQLRTSLAAQSLPPASASFLAALIDARTPPPPAASLLATAKARLLACDLAAAGDISSSSSSGGGGGGGGGGGILDSAAMASLPADVCSARTEARTLPRDVHVQVVDAENLSISRWEQVEELEAVERGERTRGREIVRVTADEDDERDADSATQHRGGAQTGVATAAAAAPAVMAGKHAVHRLVLQDCKGKTVYAVETKRMERIGIGRTSMGEKMLLRAGTVVARGSVLLTPDKTVFLGGKVDAWHEAWMSGRLARLKAAVGADRPQ